MRIKTVAGLTALLFIILLIPASAMTASEARVGTTLTASGIPQGAVVQFILNGGVPVFAVADSTGSAKYMPLLQGNLSIIAMVGGTVVDSLINIPVSPAAPAPGPSGGGGNVGGTSGGGTGGGGVVTSEPYDNIDKMERYDNNLIANTPVTYRFKMPELGIYEIVITGKENENNIALRVEFLKGTSKQVTVQAPGTVYKNINILAGTQRIKEALVRFRVENSWLGSNSLAASEVKLVKWDGSKWMQLETAQKNKDDTYTYYETMTDTFSIFAITGLKGGVITATPTPGPTSTATPGVSPTTTPLAGVPTTSLNWILYVIVAIIIIAAVYYYTVKKKVK